MQKFVLSFFIILLVIENGIAQNKPRTLLWEISGNGLKQTSYLFGVKHNANGELLIKRYPVIAEKLRGSNMIVQEIVAEEGQPFLDMNALFYTGDSTIKNILSPKDYETILGFIKEKSENNKEMTDRLLKMKPQLLSLAVGELIGEDSAETNNLDAYLLAMAKKENKQTAGLENAKDRSNSLANTVSDEKAFSMILTRINSLTTAPQKPDNTYEDLQINYYLDKSVKEDFGGVKERNVAWIIKIPDLIQQKRCFIAVGVDHLIAKSGLITLLRNSGYKVTPIKML